MLLAATAGCGCRRSGRRGRRHRWLGRLLRLFRLLLFLLLLLLWRLCCGLLCAVLLRRLRLCSAAAFPLLLAGWLLGLCSLCSGRRHQNWCCECVWRIICRGGLLRFPLLFAALLCFCLRCCIRRWWLHCCGSSRLLGLRHLACACVRIWFELVPAAALPGSRLCLSTRLGWRRIRCLLLAVCSRLLLAVWSRRCCFERCPLPVALLLPGWHLVQGVRRSWVSHCHCRRLRAIINSWRRCCSAF